jgi:RNA polymerase I-specific transcription initiation factor RRN3
MEIYDDDETLGNADEVSDHGLDKFGYSLNKMSITPKNLPIQLFGTDITGGYLQMPSRIRPSISPESL